MVNSVIYMNEFMNSVHTLLSYPIYSVCFLIHQNSSGPIYLYSAISNKMPYSALHNKPSSLTIQMAYKESMININKLSSFKITSKNFVYTKI